jgi:hypothetical protein
VPKVRLLIDGPFKYSDGVYLKGDEFDVGPKAALMYSVEGIVEIVEDEEVDEGDDHDGEGDDEGGESGGEEQEGDDAGEASRARRSGKKK